MATRVALLVFALALLVSARTGTASAHANLIRSEPAENAVLTESPFEVKLYFSEPPDLGASLVNVIDPSGNRVDNGDTHQHEDKTVLALTVPALPDGTYTVAWKTVSAVDGHVVAGTFAFSVGQPSATNAGNFAFAVGGPPRWLAALVRWLSYTSLFVLLGVAAFPRLILRPALRRSDTATGPNNVARIVMIIALTWLVAGTLLVLLMQAWTSGGDAASMVNSELKTLATSTRFGAIWWARASLTLLAVVSAATILRRDRTVDPRPGIADVPLLFAAVFLPLTVSLNSHGAADNHYAKLATGIDWLHLIAGGLWIGGLVQLAIVVPAALRSLNADARLRVLSVVIPRFSTLAIVCVATIVGSGVFQWFVILGNIHDTFHSSYGVTLLVKIGLFLPLAGLGAINLLVMRPAIAGQLGRMAHEGSARLASVFRRIVTAEVLFAVGVLAVTGVLTTGSPPFSRLSAVSNSTSFIQTKDAGSGVDLTLSVDPGLPGKNDLNLILKGVPDDEPVEHFLVRFTYQDKKLGTTEDEATAVHPTHFQLSGSQLSLTGLWRIEAIARRTGMDDIHASFDIKIGAVPTPSGPEPTLVPLPTIVGERIDVSASNSESFDQPSLQGTAGSLSIVFTNNDVGVPHNFQLFSGTDASGRAIFSTHLERGPAREFFTTQLPAGTYYYRCQIHPAMHGTLTLK